MAKVIMRHPVMKYANSDLSYFGEVNLSGKNAEPVGIGLFSDDSGKMMMFENVDGGGNGMAIYGNGNAGCLTYAVDGKVCGPHLTFNRNDDYCFDLLNESGTRHKISIRIKPDGTYAILQYDAEGYFTNRVLSFKKSLFCLEYRLSEDKERTAVVEKKVGWNFKYPFAQMYLMPYDATKSVVPSYISGTRGVCTYIGGAQTGRKLYGDCVSDFSEEERSDFNYVDFARNRAYNAIDEEIFHDLTKFGYAIHYYKDDTYYFGEIFDNKFTGIGCFKCEGYDYLGHVTKADSSPYSVEEFRTGMRVYPDGMIQFGSYKTMGDDVIFEIHDDFLYIKSYYRGERRGSYYKLDFGTFDLEEYSESNTLTESIHFPPISDAMRRDDGEKVKIKTRFKPEELLDNDERDVLSAYRYRVPKKNQIEVYEYLRELVTVEVPSIVTKIDKGTYSGNQHISSIYLSERLSELEGGSLAGVPNLVILKFNDACKIKEIPPDVCDSPSLPEVAFPKSVERIREGAFLRCKKLKKAFVHAGCVVEEHAFPRGCKIVYLSDDGYTEVKKSQKGSTPSGRGAKDRESTRRTVRTRSFSPGSVIGGVFRSLFGILSFPFRMLFLFFKWLFGAIGSLFSGLGSLGAATNVFSVIAFIVMLACTILNFFDFDTWLLNGWGYLVEDVIGSWFGMRLVELCADLFEKINSGWLISIFAYLALGILILVVFVLECVLNALCGVLLILGFVLFFVIGLGYYIAIPAGMLALAIIGLVRDRSAVNIAILVLTVCMIPLFYVGICIGL